jgi:hypothetical protein
MPVRRAGAARRLLLAAGTLWLAGPAASDTPPCLVSLELEPAEAWVDQQVLYRLRIETRPDVEGVEWLSPPSFPGLRAERLPGRPDAGVVTRDGVEYRTRVEERALYPEGPGELSLAAASLRCSAALAVQDVPLPARTLRVRPLPEAGRPAGFAGLVGALAVERQLTPASLRLGESARVVVSLRGGGNLWDAPDPLAEAAVFGEVDLFRRPPELELERGESLFVRRRFAYDVVPRRAGSFRVPELRIPYFDPDAGAYREARAAPLLVEVAGDAPAERAEAESVRATPGAGPSVRAAGSDTGTGPSVRAAGSDTGTGPSVRAAGSDTGAGLREAAWLWTALRAAAVVGLAALLWTRLRRRARRARRDLPAAAAPGDADAEARARARALRALLARRHPAAADADAEALQSARELLPDERAAARVLARLERARFDPRAQPPSSAEIDAALARLQRGRS